MGALYWVIFGVIDPTANIGETIDERYQFLGDRLTEDDEHVYQCTSRNGWIQHQFSEFCEQRQVVGLEFTKLREDVDGPDSYLLCGNDLDRAAQALEQVAAIMKGGEGKLNLRYERDIEDQQAFEQAQPNRDFIAWDVTYPTSTFIKSLTVAVNDAIRDGKCLFYILVYP